MSLAKIASYYRIKVARHLINIVSLRQELGTYNVNGLLKAASAGHSKEACLRYAGLHTAILFEQRELEKLGAVGGYNSQMRKVAVGNYGSMGGGFQDYPNPAGGAVGGASAAATAFNSARMKEQLAAPPRQYTAQEAGSQTPAARAATANAPLNPTDASRLIRAQASKPAPSYTPSQIADGGRGFEMDRLNKTDTGSRQQAILDANRAAGRQNSHETSGLFGLSNSVLDNRPGRQNLPSGAPTRGQLADDAAGTSTAARRAAIAQAGTNVGGGFPVGTNGRVAGTNVGGGPPEGFAAAQAAQAVAAAPATSVPASVIPKPGNGNSVGLGYDPTGSGAPGRYSETADPLGASGYAGHPGETEAQPEAQPVSQVQQGRGRRGGRGGPIRNMIGNVQQGQGLLGRRGR